jgi:hypothetical protein
MRRTPFDIAFGSEAETRFPEIRASLAGASLDPHDSDAFVLDRQVISLLRELVPEEGIGEGIQQHVALLQHAYLYWEQGAWLFRLTKARAKALLDESGDRPAPAAVDAAPRAYYVQFPERLIWAELDPDEPHQPLDGIFVRPWPDGGLFALAVFGMHPGQAGFSVVDVDGYLEDELVRGDGSPLFGPALAGGAAAGLHSIVGGEELLELAARTVALAAEARACVGSAHRAHDPLEIG